MREIFHRVAGREISKVHAWMKFALNTSRKKIESNDSLVLRRGIPPVFFVSRFLSKILTIGMVDGILSAKAVFFYPAKKMPMIFNQFLRAVASGSALSRFAGCKHFRQENSSIPSFWS
ncbi:hypothetical protein [Trichloromonas sp.]|uniref:hypothetical protein n=1 Tax=Trichloromonas sp. TaxID=3069249 RepID=UPI002A3C469F|nr:hypothetical protein [Trichloromonas sp.]